MTVSENIVTHTEAQIVDVSDMRFGRSPRRPAADLCDFCNEVVAEVHQMAPVHTMPSRRQWTRSTGEICYFRASIRRRLAQLEGLTDADITPVLRTDRERARQVTD